MSAAPPFQNTYQQHSQKRTLNPAEDLAYKPVKQTFGYIFALILAVIVVSATISSCITLMVYKFIGQYITDIRGEVIREIGSREIDRDQDRWLLYFMSFVEWGVTGIKLRSALIIPAQLLTLYFFFMILVYPDYCGGNPEFYKTWPVIVSSVLWALSGAFFHPVLMILTALFGLLNFVVIYCFYFGHDSSSADNRCCFCLCFKPWVYKRIDDFEAPLNQQGFQQGNPPQVFPPQDFQEYPSYPSLQHQGPYQYQKTDYQ